MDAEWRAVVRYRLTGGKREGVSSHRNYAAAVCCLFAGAAFDSYTKSALPEMASLPKRQISILNVSWRHTSVALRFLVAPLPLVDFFFGGRIGLTSPSAKTSSGRA